MIRRVFSRVWFWVRPARRSEVVHAYEIVRMQADCQRVIDGLYIDFRIRLADAEARFQRARCVDMVEASDSGLYLHPDGQVSQLGGEVGSC